MDNEAPKFNPEFSFLEDKEILELDNLIDVLGLFWLLLRSGCL